MRLSAILTLSILACLLFSLSWSMNSLTLPKKMPTQETATPEFKAKMRRMMATMEKDKVKQKQMMMKVAREAAREEELRKRDPKNYPKSPYTESAKWYRELPDGEKGITAAGAELERWERHNARQKTID